MRYRLFIFAALFIVSAAAVLAQQPAEFKGHDHSLRGGEHAVLNNILLRDSSDKLTYAGRERVEVYGKRYEASRFVVDARVYVTVYGPSECHQLDQDDFQHCQVHKDAEVEVYVGLDETGEIHDAMLREVRAFWLDNKPRSWKKAEAVEHLNYKDGEYIMFQEFRGRDFPFNRAKRLVWVDGKFIQFRFKRFKDGGTYRAGFLAALNKDEALENFVGMGIYVRPRAVKMQPRRMKGAFREEFLKLYASGAFGRVAQPKPDGSSLRLRG